MLLRAPNYYQRPAKLNPGGILLLGSQGVTVDLDRTKPMEGVIVQVTMTVAGGGAITLATAANGLFENVLQICKRIRVTRPAGVQNPAGTTVVDYRGIGLIERALNSGTNVDAATLTSISLSQGTTIAANMTFRVSYWVPFVRPGIGDPLLSRCLLPCHLWQENPTMIIDFAQAPELYSANALSYVGVDLIYVRRQQTPKWAGDASQANAANYFIPGDLIESNFQYPVNASAECRLALPQRGWYLDMQFCHYLGGAAATNVTRNVPDAITTLGAETEIQRQDGGNTIEKFLWKHLLTLNGYSRVQNSTNQTYSPVPGLPVLANTSYPSPASVMKDFCSDGIGTGDQVTTEGGSWLDAETPFNNGQKVEYVLTPAAVAYASITYYGGHRLWGANIPRLLAVQ